MDGPTICWRLHRKLRADYDSPDMPPPPRPKWMRWKTYSRIARRIEAGQERLDVVSQSEHSDSSGGSRGRNRPGEIDDGPSARVA